MVRVTTLCLLSASAAALSIPRDAGTIEADLKSLNLAYQDLKAADEAYGSTGDSASVQPAVDTVALDTLLAAVDATTSTPLSESDITTINEYIGNTLEPSVKAAIAATVANKAQLEKAGLTSVVSGELVALMLDTDALGVSLDLKEPKQSDQDDLNKAIEKIDADYLQGVRELGKPSDAGS